MYNLYALLFSRPNVGLQILLTSFFINLIALASAIYVMQVYGHYIRHGIDGTLITLTVGMMFAMLLDYALKKVRYQLAMVVLAGPDRELGEGVAKRLLSIRTESFMGLPPGGSRQVLRDLDKVQSTFTPANLLALVDIPFAMIMVAAVLAISPVLGVFVLAILVIGLLFTVINTYHLQRLNQSFQEAQGGQGSWLASSERVETVRISTAESFLHQQWLKRHSLVRWRRALTEKQQARLQTFMQTLSVLLSMVVVAVGAKLISMEELNFGVLMGANIMAGRILSTISRPASVLMLLVQGAQHRKQLDKFLALPAENVEGSSLPQYTGRLEFNDLSFGYPDGNGPLFEHVNLSLSAGQILIVTGGNGTGKTTFSRLLAGLLAPDRGTIIADGVDIRQFDPLWWRRQLVYLPQEPLFLDATLRENFTTLNPKLGDEELVQLLKQVGLDTFLAQSKDGLNMSLRDGGRTLSPGIRRRLALVRALTTNGRLVIIDEPAEGLDHPGALIVNQVLNTLLKEGRTLVVMTHNPESLRAVGPILDLNHKPVPRITVSDGKT
jgi:ATP-binding cassette, subfamily C, bacterial LapB